MNLAQEIERLAKLHAEGALTAEEFARAKGQLLSIPAFAKLPVKSVRRESPRKFFGLPLWAIAIGPDSERGEMRGHARGIFALGDIATGWFAFGGLARRFFAFGGLAIGLFAFGGAAIGGLAIGGGALGGVAIGGGACGYYAFGGGAVGIHTVSPLHRDPAALDFSRQYFPWLIKFVHR